MDTSGLGEHRIRLRYETNGPLQLDSVADAFAALEAQYVEALRRRGYKPGGGTAKLYVTELRSGSLEAEIAAAAVVLGAAVQAMDVSLVIHDFSQRLRSLLAWFAGRSDERPPMERRDVDHVCQLLEVVKDRPDAAMLLQQSRIVQRENGLEKETLLELGLDRKGIERGYDRAVRERDALAAKEEDPGRFVRNALFYWHTASVAQRRNAKRSPDRGIIEAISARDVRVFFPEGANELKRRMTEIEGNPFKKAFVVDAYVQTIGDRPQLYTIVDLHEVFDRDDDAGSDTPDMLPG